MTPPALRRRLPQTPPPPSAPPGRWRCPRWSWWTRCALAEQSWPREKSTSRPWMPPKLPTPRLLSPRPSTAAPSTPSSAASIRSSTPPPPTKPPPPPPASTRAARRCSPPMPAPRPRQPRCPPRAREGRRRPSSVSSISLGSRRLRQTRLSSSASTLRMKCCRPSSTPTRFGSSRPSTKPRGCHGSTSSLTTTRPSSSCSRPSVWVPSPCSMRSAGFRQAPPPPSWRSWRAAGHWTTPCSRCHHSSGRRAGRPSAYGTTRGRSVTTRLSSS
mmetsp:Transcript_4085/g.13469  ORF Transcript_4085/g.13469 Transcript_4085/m.13469 type:complete len:271 (+) Transcript_4085:349-1161(+)